MAAKVQRVQKSLVPRVCGKCKAEVPKGSPYVWWQFPRERGRFFRCAAPACQPRPSELTRSDYLSQLYALQERCEDLTMDDGLADELDSLASDVRELGEEQQGKYDNMPEGLQQGPTGEQVQARADACETIASALDDAAQSCRELCEELTQDPTDERREEIEAEMRQHVEDVDWSEE